MSDLTRREVDEERVDARPRTFFENPVVVYAVLPLFVLAVAVFAGWFFLFRDDVTSSTASLVQPKVTPTLPAMVVQPTAVIIQRPAVPTQVPQEEPTPEPEDLAPFVSAPANGADRVGKVLLITSMASDMSVRRASAAQIDMEFPELAGVPKLSAEELESATLALKALFDNPTLTQTANDFNKLALDQAAWYIRQHISNDMALHGFYGGFMQNALNREFAAAQALASKAAPEELFAYADDVARASHEVEAAIVFLNPISSVGSYPALDQSLLAESSTLLGRLRGLHEALLVATAPTPMPLPTSAPTPMADVLPAADPNAAPNVSPQVGSLPFPAINPGVVHKIELHSAPVNLNTPAEASSITESDGTEPQVCEGPLLLDGETVVGVMPVNLVNWFVWGKSHLGGGPYTRPMYKVAQIIPYEPASVDLINEHPIVVDFPVVEYLLEKVLGEGPGVVSFYVTDEGNSRLIDMGMHVGRTVEFTTILGLIGP